MCRVQGDAQCGRQECSNKKNASVKFVVLHCIAGHQHSKSALYLQNSTIHISFIYLNAILLGVNEDSKLF